MALINRPDCLDYVVLALTRAEITVKKWKYSGEERKGSIDGQIKEVDFSINLRQVWIGSILTFTVVDKNNFDSKDYQTAINRISHTLDMNPMSILTDDTKMTVTWTDNANLID